MSDFPIAYHDDCKGEWQSVTASLEFINDCCTMEVCGFGRDEAEAKRDLLARLQPLLDFLRPLMEGA